MIPLSKKKKLHQGYGAMQKKKEIKDAYPKKVCHMPRHVKIKEENKRSIPKEGMPHASACQKKMRRDSPYPKERKRDGSY